MRLQHQQPRFISMGREAGVMCCHLIFICLLPPCSTLGYYHLRYLPFIYPEGAQHVCLDHP